MLNTAPSKLLPFPPHSLKEALKQEFNFKDVLTMRNFNNKEFTLLPFMALFKMTGFVDEQVFGNYEEKLLEYVEEFALFFMSTFRAELDITFFFYRSLYGQFSFNLENAIKVLYCLHKMTGDEGEGAEEEEQANADGV